jgi:hypothetical protein
MKLAIVISGTQSFFSSLSLARNIYEITNEPVIYISLCKRDYILPDDYEEEKNRKYKYIERITYIMDILQSSYNDNYLFRISLNSVEKKYKSFLEREGVGGIIALQPEVTYMKANFGLLVTLKDLKIPMIVMIDNIYTYSFMINLSDHNFCYLLITDPKISLKIYFDHNICSKKTILISKKHYKDVIQIQKQIKLELRINEEKNISAIVGANLKYPETINNISKNLNDDSYVIIPLEGIYPEDNIDKLFNLVFKSVPSDKHYLIKVIITNNIIVYFSSDTLSKYFNKNLFQRDNDIYELLYYASDFIYETDKHNNRLYLTDVDIQEQETNIRDNTIKQLLGFTIWRDVESIIDDQEEQNEDITCSCSIQ